MSELVELLRGIFTRHGFEVRPAPNGNVLAVQGEDAVLVHCSEKGIAQVDFPALANTATEEGAARVIVITLAEEPPVAGPEGFELWSRGRFAAEIGAAVIDYSFPPVAAPKPPADAPSGGRTVPTDNPRQFRSLVARAASGNAYASLGVHFLPSKPTRSIEAPAASTILPNAFSGRAAVAAPNATLAADARSRNAIAMNVPNKPRVNAAASAAPAPVAQVEVPSKTATIRGKEVNLAPNDDVEIFVSAPKSAPTSPEFKADARVLKPTLTKAAATERAQSTVGRVKRTSLELVPHHAFSYALNLVVEGMEKPLTGGGTVLANAVTGALSELPELAYTERAMDHAQIALAKYDVPDVYGAAKNHLVRAFTRDVKVRREIHEVEMEELRHIVPTTADLNLAAVGTVLAPIWIVEGESGTVEINGFTS